MEKGWQQVGLRRVQAKRPQRLQAQDVDRFGDRGQVRMGMVKTKQWLMVELQEASPSESAMRQGVRIGSCRRWPRRWTRSSSLSRQALSAISGSCQGEDAGRAISTDPSFPRSRARISRDDRRFEQKQADRTCERLRATFLACEAPKYYDHLNIAIPINHGVRHSPGIDSVWSPHSRRPLPPSMSLSAQQPVEDGHATASSHRCRSATSTPDSSCHRDRRARRS